MLCKEKGCPNRVKSRGLCNAHYLLFRRKGLLKIGEDGRGIHGHHARGKTHYKWNEERMLNSSGYVLIRVPEGHPRRQANGYAYEHDLVAEKMLSRHLRKGEVVHHKNRIRTDNRPENLEVETASLHAKIHYPLRHIDPKTGQFMGGAGGDGAGDDKLNGMQYHFLPLKNAVGQFIRSDERVPQAEILKADEQPRVLTLESFSG